MCQIIATSHDQKPPIGSGLEGKSPKISGKSRLVKYYFIWPDIFGQIFVCGCQPKNRGILHPKWMVKIMEKNTFFNG